MLKCWTLTNRSLGMSGLAQLIWQLELMWISLRESERTCHSLPRVLEVSPNNRSCHKFTLYTQSLSQKKRPEALFSAQGTGSARRLKDLGLERSQLQALSLTAGRRPTGGRNSGLVCQTVFPSCKSRHSGNCFIPVCTRVQMQKKKKWLAQGRNLSSNHLFGFPPELLLAYMMEQIFSCDNWVELLLS